MESKEETFNFKRAYDSIRSGEYEKQQMKVMRYDNLMYERINSLKLEIDQKTSEIRKREELLNKVITLRENLKTGNLTCLPTHITFTTYCYELTCTLMKELFDEYPSIADFIEVRYNIFSEDGKLKMVRTSWIDYLKKGSFGDGDNCINAIVFKSPQSNNSESGIEVPSASEEEKKE